MSVVILLWTVSVVVWFLISSASTGGQPECGCWKCLGAKHKIVSHYVVCPTCGSKHCPRASDHELACTG